MTYLDIRTGQTLIEQRMVEAVRLCFGHRWPEVADLTALAALETAPAWDGQLRYVLSEGVVYRWAAASTNVQALPYVVGTGSNGRWERQQSTITKGPNYYLPVHRVREGYAKQVIFWEGQGGSDDALDRIFSATPAFLIRCTGDSIGSKVTGGPYGSIYDWELRFEIWCFSKNYRPQNQAIWGSDITSEQTSTSDPGLNRMVGDIRYLFGTGTDLGLGPGVRHCRINGDMEYAEEFLDSREFIAKVPVLVQAAVSIPDEDLVPLDEIWVQFMDAGLPILADGTRGEIDLNNYVQQGYQIPPIASLIGRAAPGVAYVEGRLVSSAPPPHLFTASKDTYRYLQTDGTLAYSEVAHNADRPAQPSGTLLLGVTRTDASAIINDAILCGYAVNSGEPFRAS